MTFIDWSDSEGMFDLLLEFIRDEKNASAGDPPRQRFLNCLSRNMLPTKKLSRTKAINYLKAICDSIDNEFKDDPVVVHVTDFIEELERIR